MPSLRSLDLPTLGRPTQKPADVAPDGMLSYREGSAAPPPLRPSRSSSPLITTRPGPAAVPRVSPLAPSLLLRRQDTSMATLAARVDSHPRVAYHAEDEDRNVPQDPPEYLRGMAPQPAVYESRYAQEGSSAFPDNDLFRLHALGSLVSLPDSLSWNGRQQQSAASPPPAYGPRPVEADSTVFPDDDLFRLHASGSLASLPDAPLWNGRQHEPVMQPDPFDANRFPPLPPARAQATSNIPRESRTSNEQQESDYGRRSPSLLSQTAVRRAGIVGSPGSKSALTTPCLGRLQAKQVDMYTSGQH